MNGRQTKKLIWETNTPPPTNYIWVKPNGKPYEFNNNTKKWEESNCFGGISENMSEEEQMEVRKNLGLYYEETSVGEKTAQYNGEEMSFQDNDNWAKVSDDTPAKTDIVSIAEIPVSDETNVEFSDKTDGYKIYPIGAPSGVQYRIVLNDSANHEPGIYYDTIGAEYASMSPLIYKGETTTVSKIDTKFLPEQEGGGMPVLRLLKMPPTTNPGQGDVIDITEYFSQEDADKLFNLESCFIVYKDNNNSGMPFVITTGYISQGMMGDITKMVYTKDFNGNEYIFSAQDWGGTIQYGIQYNPKQTDTVDITQLPTNGMTQQQLEGIGITVNDLVQIGIGNKRGFKFNNYVYPVISVDFVDSYKLIIEFWTSTNKHVISVDNTMRQILSCTVTSR